MENIFNTLSSYGFLEWLGLLSGIIYVILSAQNKIICWVFGIISCACIAYHDFFGGLKLYSDGILQSFYIIMGFIGIYEWKRREIKASNSLNSKELSNHLVLIVSGVIASIILAKVMKNFSDSYYPTIDAFTTVFSIIATILLVRRVLSAWIYFIFIDIVMSVIYYLRSWELYALLYAVFTVIAIYGTLNWYRIIKKKPIII